MSRAQLTSTVEQNTGGAVAPFVAGKNKIINGDMNVNQRNFSSSSSVYQYTVDRWLFDGSTGTVTCSVQPFTAGTAPVAGYEAKQYLQLVTSGQSGVSSYAFLQYANEDVRTFAGQTVTVSFWAKAATGTPTIAVDYDQYFGVGGTATDVTGNIGSVAITTSWARYSMTVEIPSISGKTIGTGSWLINHFFVSAGSNFNARTNSIGIQSNTFSIWGVQLEAGSVATPFTTATGTLSGELEACQRYYWRAGGDAAYQTLATGCIVEGSAVLMGLANPVPMRIAPTSVDYSTLMVYDGNTINTVSTVALNYASRYISRVQGNPTTAPTANRPYWLFTNNSTSAYIGFSAEL